MALSGGIPMPQNKDMFEGIMEQWMKQKELEQTGKYQQGQLDIQKKADARAEAELPYLLQQHTDVHGKAASEAQMTHYKQKLMEKFMRDHHMLNGTQPQGAAPQEPGMGGGQMPPPPQGMPPMPQPGQEPPQMPPPNMPMSQPGDKLRFGEADEPGTHPINAPDSPFKRLERSGAIPMQRPQEAPPVAESAAPAKDDFSDVSAPEASLIKDALGFDPLAKTAEQKAELEANKAEKIADARQNVKTAAVIKASKNKMETIKNLVEEAKEIMARKKNLTGPLAGRVAKAGFSKDEDLNRLNTIFGQLQGETSTLYSPRGGIGAIKWAASVKPDITKEDAANRGMLKAIEQNYQNTMKQYDEELEELGHGGKKESSPRVKYKVVDGKLVKA